MRPILPRHWIELYLKTTLLWKNNDILVIIKNWRGGGVSVTDEEVLPLKIHTDTDWPGFIEIRIRINSIDWAKDKMTVRNTGLSFGSSSSATGSLDNDSHF